jgi:hypothetical protein
LGSAKAGDHFSAEFDAEEDTLVFRRVAARGDWLEGLKACPVAMDDLPPRRRPNFPAAGSDSKSCRPRRRRLRR